MVLRDLDAWLASEAPAVVLRHDLHPLLLTRLACGAGGALWRDLRRLAVYQDSPKSALHGWLASTLADLEGELLELGCGLGGHDDERPVGLDLHWASLRRYPGRAVLGDALDPPFRAASFDAVLAINLLDSCRDPFLLLQQADALLRPGGTLVLSAPFHWRDEVTPPRSRLDPHQVQHFLEHQGYATDRSEVEWVLTPDPRTRTTHRCLTWIARRSR